MYIILLASAVPASLAAHFESPGLALLGGAGFLWALAVFVSSSAPVVAGPSSSLNERISALLSVTATLAATAGASILAAGLLA